MKVRDLKDELDKYDDDLDVYYKDEEWYTKIKEVKLKVVGKKKVKFYNRKKLGREEKEIIYLK